MAGSEHSTSKTPGLAERPVSGNLDDRNGHKVLICWRRKRPFNWHAAAKALACVIPTAQLSSLKIPEVFTPAA